MKQIQELKSKIMQNSAALRRLEENPAIKEFYQLCNVRNQLLDDIDNLMRQLDKPAKGKIINFGDNFSVIFKNNGKIAIDVLRKNFKELLLKEGVIARVSVTKLRALYMADVISKTDWEKIYSEEDGIQIKIPPKINVEI